MAVTCDSFAPASSGVAERVLRDINVYACSNMLDGVHGVGYADYHRGHDQDNVDEYVNARWWEQFSVANGKLDYFSVSGVVVHDEQFFDDTEYDHCGHDPDALHAPGTGCQDHRRACEGPAE